MYIRRLFEQIYSQFMLYSLILCFAFPMKIDFLLSLFFLSSFNLQYVQCFLFDVSINTIEVPRRSWSCANPLRLAFHLRRNPIPPCQDPPVCQFKEAMTSVEDLIHKWCFLRGIFETLSQSPMTWCIMKLINLQVGGNIMCVDMMEMIPLHSCANVRANVSWVDIPKMGMLTRYTAT